MVCLLPFQLILPITRGKCHCNYLLLFRRLGFQNWNTISLTNRLPHAFPCCRFYVNIDLNFVSGCSIWSRISVTFSWPALEVFFSMRVCFSCQVFLSFILRGQDGWASIRFRSVSFYLLSRLSMPLSSSETSFGFQHASRNCMTTFQIQAENAILF